MSVAPLSKCELLAAIRGAARSANTAIADMRAVPVDGFALTAAQDVYDCAVATLVALHLEAEEAGLLDELSGYLTASYGG
jgi:hypothetical protein